MTGSQLTALAHQTSDPAVLASIDEERGRRAWQNNDDDSDAITAPDGYRLTDVANAARLIDLVGDKIRYVHEWQRWIAYEGGRWEVDGGDALVMERAKAVGRSLFKQAKRADQATRAAVFTAAKRAESAGAYRGDGAAGTWQPEGPGCP